MRALVTGGAGFIGSHLAQRLLTLGHDVRILDNFSTGHRANLASIVDVEVVEGDIQSYERCHRAAAGCEVIFHEAALPSVPRSFEDPLTSNATNVTGTLNVLLAARDHGARRVVYASSSSVYGANPDLPKKEGMPALPISPYATAKLAGEGHCRAFNVGYGLETVALRYFNIFGPRQDPASAYAAVIPKFITALMDGESPVIYGDGEQSRDFTYIENVLAANLLAMDSPTAPGQTFNVACGERFTLNFLIGELQELLETEIEPHYTRARPGDVPHSQADITAAREKLGFEPAVRLREGLERTIADLREGRSRSVAAQRG